MSLIVQKFGGSSVANAERVFNVAKIVTDTYKQGNDVVVVVSAQGDTTDDLIEKANEINPNASKREKDMLLASGEQISIALLAMAIEKLGFPVISLLGWQAGFQTTSAYTSARIKRVRTDRIAKELDKKNIVIVAGFQGLNRYEDVTTLGRGGSDTTTEKFFLLSRSEVYGGLENSVNEGTPYPYYADYSQLGNTAGTGADSNRVKTKLSGHLPDSHAFAGNPVITVVPAICKQTCIQFFKRLNVQHRHEVVSAYQSDQTFH